MKNLSIKWIFRTYVFALFLVYVLGLFFTQLSLWMPEQVLNLASRIPSFKYMYEYTLQTRNIEFADRYLATSVLMGIVTVLAFCFFALFLCLTFLTRIEIEKRYRPIKLGGIALAVLLVFVLYLFFSGNIAQKLIARSVDNSAIKSMSKGKFIFVVDGIP